MTKIKDTKIFETNNVDLAAFLIFKGIRLLELTKDPLNSRIVLIRFVDDKQNCLDLERVYLNSDFKKFRDINKYLLSKIHQELRS